MIFHFKRATRLWMRSILNAATTFPASGYYDLLDQPPALWLK